MNNEERPSWDEYFKEIVQVTSKRSPCDRLKVGCLLVKDNRIISQGYNGARTHKDINALDFSMSVGTNIYAIRGGTVIKVIENNDCFFHVDGAQGFGKKLDTLKNKRIDLISISGHKIYGPKGIGALFVRRKPRVRIEAQIHGGGHERGMRSGTLATHQIVGMGEAFKIAREEMDEENNRIKNLQAKLLKGLTEIEETFVNGDLEKRVPHNLNISFNYVEGESLIMAIKGIAVSSGSACTSASLEPSYVLRALGRSDELAHSSIRFSIGRFTTESDVEFTIALLKEKIGKLRELSPLWEMFKDGVDLEKVEWAEH